MCRGVLRKKTSSSDVATLPAMFFRAASILLLTSVSVLACSSSSTDQTPAGEDGGGGDGGGGGGGDGGGTPSAASYCQLEKARFERCLPEKTECRKDLEASCATRDAFYSPAHAKAFAQCSATDGCGRTTVDSPCGQAIINASTPSAAQQKLADDFCTACAKAPSVREQGIACQGNVVTGGYLGPYLLALSDAAAATVGSKCIEPAKAQFPNDYANCETLFTNCIISQLAVPPSCE